MLISVDFGKSKYGYAMDSRIRAALRSGRKAHLTNLPCIGKTLSLHLTVHGASPAYVRTY